MDHDEPTRARLRGLARELGLLTTGSSDYHGTRKFVELGACTTDPEIYGEITRRATGAFPVPGAAWSRSPLGRVRRITAGQPPGPFSHRTTSPLPARPCAYRRVPATAAAAARTPRPLRNARSSLARLTVFDVAVFGSLFLTLFVIMDPPGITPIFLALTAGRPAKVQRKMALQAVMVAFGVIAVFGLLGQQILDYLHVSVPALMIAGGLLLLLIALDLLTGKTDEPTQTKDVNVALVPLGMPLLAGPGAIVSVILAVQHADGVGGQLSVWSAIVAMHVVLWLTMRYSLVIIRVIKDGGVVLVTRLMRHDALRHRRPADHQRRHPGHPERLNPPHAPRRPRTDVPCGGASSSAAQCGEARGLGRRHEPRCVTKPSCRPDGCRCAGPSLRPAARSG